MNTTAPDVLVVGLGAMGAATVRALAKQGHSVVGIDRFDPPHAQGSTHGETRITREATGEGMAFVPLAQRSHQLWREIEAESGVTLFTACGALMIARKGLASQLHGNADFLGRTIDAARAFNIQHELLDADGISRRYPQLNLVGDEHAYFEPGAGFVRPEAAVSAQLTLARRGYMHRGAELITNTVAHVRHENGKPVVEANGKTFHPGKLVIAAGAWLPGMVPPVSARLRVTRQVLYWFQHDGTRQYHHRDFPVYIWNWGPGAGDVFYGFPQVGEAAEIKVATEVPDVLASPDQVDRAVSAEAVHAMHEKHIGPRMHRVLAHATRIATCLYTETRDANFIIDALPDHPDTIVVSACSGHGFKHSAAIGAAVAAFAIDGVKPHVLTPFSWTTHAQV